MIYLVFVLFSIIVFSKFHLYHEFSRLYIIIIIPKSHYTGGCCETPILITTSHPFERIFIDLQINTSFDVCLQNVQTFDHYAIQRVKEVIKKTNVED